jgi:hypothetical protein
MVVSPTVLTTTTTPVTETAETPVVVYWTISTLLRPRVVGLAMTAPSVVVVRAEMSKMVDVSVASDAKVLSDWVTVERVMVEIIGSVAIGVAGIACARGNRTNTQHKVV